MWAAEMDDEQVGVPEPKPRTYRVKVHEWPLPFDRRFDRSKKRSAPAAVGAAPDRKGTP